MNNESQMSFGQRIALKQRAGFDNKIREELFERREKAS